MNSDEADWAARLGQISDALHDCWFDLERLDFHRGRRLLVLPLSEDRKMRDDCTLVMRGVADVDVIDTERVQIYDINRMRRDIDREASLTIEGNIPIEVRIDLIRPWSVSLTREWSEGD